MPKRSIRQNLLMQRQLLDASECQQRSRVIQRRLLETDEFRQASTIALYAPIHNEVDTADIFLTALRDGQTVFFPRILGSSLEFVQVEKPEALLPGAFGIAEPTGTAICSVASIDLVVVPGVGFDRNGFRLGYGQGYYDRAVRSGCTTVLAGLAYDFQIEDKLPAENHDICLDLLVAESELLVFRNIHQH